MSDQQGESSSVKLVADSPSSSKVAKFFGNKLSEEKSKQNGSNANKSPKQLRPEGYGRPKAGSLTELRGKKANVQVYREMLELCIIIADNGKPDAKDPVVKTILFGELFEIYVSISNKVVGLLLRARKFNILEFEGEMLFQKFHDHVPIRLLRPMSEIKAVLAWKESEVGLSSNE